MLRYVFYAFALVILLIAAAIVAPNDKRPKQLTLNGTGTVQQAPDMATIRVGVVTDADTAAEALAANSRDTSAVIDRLKAAEVANNDIQTVNFSINPVYKNRQSSGERNGGADFYRVSNMVVATVRDLDALGGVLDATVGAGANTISGISFGLSAQDDAMDEARRLAVENAQAKADLYAKEMGLQLGSVVDFSEAGGFIAPRADMGRMMAAAEAVPVQAGEIGVSATVTVVWDIAQ